MTDLDALICQATVSPKELKDLREELRNEFLGEIRELKEKIRTMEVKSGAFYRAIAAAAHEVADIASVTTADCELYSEYGAVMPSSASARNVRRRMGP